MPDIQNRQDLELLLARFYDTLLQNPEMHRIFIDVAKIDMAEHLPTITDFWEQVLLHSGVYKKNVMQLHVELNEKAKLSPGHFQTWLKTFEAAVNENFSGENAEIVKTRALSIATIMQVKIR
ncbi:group III truncated hemoglobin [Flavobacterium selenitireducens]|uniref:group III truncated hemoglobin n=1 Tax=Flavobacterium selenitireducens TaxID=2722704 RepID=UPI00168AF9F6|nr:group III truncated hemoglobin [Flavobacterium selenitireducens]MBD3583688.1 group III truncated hemoglobin [Flavobacterium selenitireducens]